MSMNSDPNSDCKQCTESKLGWVHNAHTKGSGCAHSVPRPRLHYAQVARALLPGRAHGAVSWRTRRHIVAPFLPCRRRLLPCRRAHASAVVSCRSLPAAIQKLYSDIEPLPHARACSYIVSQSAGPCRSAVSRTHATPCRDTKFMSRYKTPCRARCVPCRARAATCRLAMSHLAMCAQLPCVTIQSAVS